MRNQFVFATNNKHKIDEIRIAVGNTIKILTLTDIGCDVEIPENAPDLKGNALFKANFIYQKYKTNCFADDTGLEVEALNGRPGVHSARYSIPEMPDIPSEKRSEANMDKLLSEMQFITNRKARFRTVIAFIENEKEHFFEGIVEGLITTSPKGKKGFGYDPIFIPDGYTNTFAELSIEEKNLISHRARAIRKLVDFLKNRYL